MIRYGSLCQLCLSKSFEDVSTGCKTKLCVDPNTDTIKTSFGHIIKNTSIFPVFFKNKINKDSKAMACK